MSPDSPEPVPRPPHPLALALIERLRDRPAARVLEVGAGSGRNTRALRAAGLEVRTLPVQDPCAAALTTHALLHGTPASIAAQLDDIADALEPASPLFATFASVSDARYGTGNTLEPHVYEALDGDEVGIAHAYFDETRLRALLSPRFAIESIHETCVDDIAGKWAHERRPLRGAVHWFVVASRR
ncbi:MAG TPA: hypothetical protein VK702_05590 [Candidatus Acidoferrum sp.]|jgi:hypothetical protein|nr:hypothetical protein [Candidatus Acidoferrum sp.]